MLSVFPQLLFLSLLGPTLLRITAGCVFLYLAYHHFQNRSTVAHELGRFVGAGTIIAPIYALIELGIAVALITGSWTQPAALVGFVIALKMLLLRESFHATKPLSQLSYFLLSLICLCLVVMGAGAFAFDLPL